MKTFCSFTSSIAPVLLLTGQLLAGGQVAEVPKTTAQLSWPNPDWPRATPAEVGLDEAMLTQARDYALTTGGSGCIIRHGKLVLAWGESKQLYDLKSTTKSFGATVLGLAVMDGTVQLDAKEFAVLAGISYSTARSWFKTPGFPVIGNVVFWSDFLQWRRARSKVPDTSCESENSPDLPAPTRPARSWTGRAARILSEFS